MKKKQFDKAVVVELDEAKTSDELTDEEERILRMRSGASLPGDHVLESKVDAVADDRKKEVLARLALMQAEILEALEENPELRTDRKQRIVSALKDQNED